MLPTLVGLHTAVAQKTFVENESFGALLTLYNFTAMSFLENVMDFIDGFVDGYIEGRNSTYEEEE